MLEEGADIRFTQAMLGRGDLKSTQVSIEKLREILKATHPAKIMTAKTASQ